MKKQLQFYNHTLNSFISISWDFFLLLLPPFFIHIQKNFFFILINQNKMKKFMMNHLCIFFFFRLLRLPPPFVLIIYSTYNFNAIMHHLLITFYVTSRNFIYLSIYFFSIFIIFSSFLV